MSKLIVNTIEAQTCLAQTIKYDSDTTGLTLNSDGIVLKPNVVAFSAKSTAGNGAQTTKVIPIQTKNFDIGGNYDTTNSRFTAPVNGVYHFDFTVHSTSGQASAAWIRKNGTNYMRSYYASTSGGYEGQCIINVNMQLDANDYVDIYSSGNYYFYLVSGYNEFSGFLIG